MSFFCQVFDRTKDPAGDDVALDLGKPDLDLVKPRSIGGCKMDPHVGMTFDKLPDSRVAMGREIICNVNLLTLGKAGHDLLQESDKLRTGVDEGWFGRFLAAKIEFSYGAWADCKFAGFTPSVVRIHSCPYLSHSHRL